MNNGIASSFFQVNTANVKIIALPRPVEMGPSAGHWQTVTNVYAHLALSVRIARMTSTSATGTRVDTVPARIFTDLTSKWRMTCLMFTRILSLLRSFLQRGQVFQFAWWLLTFYNRNSKIFLNIYIKTICISWQ